MKDWTSGTLLAQIAQQLATFDPIIDKKEMKISFKGDFWINIWFYRQYRADSHIAALTNNLDFIPPDLNDEDIKRMLYQSCSRCSLDYLFEEAQPVEQSQKIHRMEILKDEQWEGSILQQNFDTFYLPVLEQMLHADFCIKLMLGEELGVGDYKFNTKNVDKSRDIYMMIGAYHLAAAYKQDKYYPTIMEAAAKSLEHPSQKELLKRILERRGIPEEFKELL